MNDKIREAEARHFADHEPLPILTQEEVEVAMARDSVSPKGGPFLYPIGEEEEDERA